MGNFLLTKRVEGPSLIENSTMVLFPIMFGILEQLDKRLKDSANTSNKSTFAAFLNNEVNIFCLLF